MPTTVRTVTQTADNCGNGGFTFRNTISTLVTGSLGQVRVTLNAATGNPGVTFDHVSIGVSNGTNGDTVATPVELLFAGGHGVTIAQSASATSDWANFSFLSTDVLVVIIDWNAGSSCDRFTSTDANTTLWFKGATASYNLATLAGVTSAASECDAVSLIETQAGGAAAPVVVAPMQLPIASQQRIWWSY